MKVSSLQIVQIRQTPALMGIDIDPGNYSIRQPQAELQMKTQPAVLEIHKYQPELSIDQSRAFEAYHGGFSMNKRIYSGIQQQFLQGIAERVQKGDRMASIQSSGNTVSEIFGTDWLPRPFPEIRGPASMDNVDIHFEIRSPELSFRPAESELNVVVNRPEIEFIRGQLNIYVKQYSSIQFTPPEVNVTM
ncbi:DUF6470 family protein [Paenibacillus antarcticus]|uniref:Uncharacterized protein n=1 Tax=Paenibacillus antarcticus TaxID=253703 RepID=A0A168QEW1_9BACL|nr:DUF6470 family protein [Paenibacillus antarcticus]OAB47708.1 hypothetical protein PBAT_05760 [Paenibacillus antarcticus]